MSYELRAVIAGDDALRGVVRELPAAHSAPLGQGLSLLPVTNARLDAAGGDTTRPLGFRWLPAGFDARLVAWSAAGPVAFVEAEYFGGVGEQRAAVWAGGALVLGPLAVGEGERLPVGGSPISQALRRLGAVARDGGDEFSAVGLGRHRRSGRWIS
ncbi:hypothetical protein [Streptomyces sp. NPDC052015]|uniref:hypothetical protein n=1 Tax=Streptomyces sp. NPDC052015 TaxID=3154755 RepID=UPI00344993CF